MKRAVGLALATMVSACAMSDDVPAVEMVLDQPTVVISTESLLLALAVDMSIDADGNLFVLDWTGHLTNKNTKTHHQLTSPRTLTTHLLQEEIEQVATCG